MHAARAEHKIAMYQSRADARRDGAWWWCGGRGGGDAEKAPVGVIARLLLRTWLCVVCVCAYVMVSLVSAHVLVKSVSNNTYLVI